MGELKRQDIIDDDALMAPLVLQKNFEKLLGTVKMVIDAGEKHNQVIGKATSTTTLKEETAKLTKEQQELIKVQNQIATVVAKNNDAYREQEKELQTLKQQIKDKTTLGDKEATSINKQNASITQLSAALTKNRQAYAQLKTEQERNSKSGKDLLKIIQQQDQEFKELNASMGMHQANVGNYKSAVEGLDGATGGLIGRFKMLGSQLAALAVNPFVLMLSAIIAGIAALTSSVKTFFDTTGDGEDMLERQSAVWNQFFVTLKNGWAGVGKSVTEFFGESILKGLLTAVLYQVAPALATSFAMTADEAVKLANKVDKMTDKMIENIITSATTQTDANELVLKSQDKLNYSDDQRQRMLEKAVELKQKQMQIDVAFAKQQADALLLQIGLEHGLTENSTRKLTQEQKYSIFKEDENRKLAEATAHIIELEGQYYEEVRKNTGKIIALKQEIAKANADALAAVYESQIAKAKEESNRLHEEAKKEMDRRIMLVEQEVILSLKTRKEGDAQIANLEKQMADDLINAQIKGLQKLLLVEGLNEKEREEIEKKLYQLRVDLQKAYYDQVAQLPEITIKAYDREIAFLTNLEKQYNAFGSGITGLFHDITESRIQEIDAQEAYLQQSLDNELEAAGDNELAKTRIKKKFAAEQAELEKKKIAEQRKAAIFDKAATAAQAAIATALAVIRAIATPPAPNFPLGILAGAAGAIQVAAILAKPIPQYAEGTKEGGHKGGLAIVGEKGQELMVTPSGNISLTPAKPTLLNLPSGTEVIPHEETMMMLALSALSSNDSFQSENNNYGFEMMGRKIDQLNTTIKNKRELHVNFSREGAEATIKHAESRIKFLNDFYY